MYKINTAVWEITLRCNINCLHCGSSADINTRPNELTTGEAFSLIEQLAELGCQRVVLSGGEPYMRKDWSALAQKVKQLGMECGIISNGYLISQDVIDVLKALKIDTLGFSLDASCAKTHDYIRGKDGVFDHLMWAIEELKKNKFIVSIVTTIHKGNIHELEDMKHLLLDKGVDYWQIQTANIRGRMPQEWALTDIDYYNVGAFIAQNRGRYKNIMSIVEADCIGYFSKLTPLMAMQNWTGCNAGMAAIGIESDGSIKGCLSMQDKSYVEGNIREKSLREIWTNPDGFKYNRRFDPANLDGICKDCKYGCICRGGCSEKSMSYTGKLHSSPFCMHHMEKTGRVVLEDFCCKD